MAGEWLKFDASTPDKPEVLAITVAMGWDDPDLTVGKLLRVWRWFDQQTIDGNAVGVTAALLDRLLGVSGLCAAMAKVGWLLITDEGLSLPNFDRHNGKTAKDRALTAKRVANHKANAQGNGKGNGASVSGALPREDKRREEDTPHTPPAGGRRSRAPVVPKPDDVSEQVWTDWLALRKSKRAGVTPTVLSEAKSEASKAGLSLERFLTVWCIRGSQGLQADWLKPNELAQTSQRLHDREASDRADPRPQWALDAGFASVYEARNEGCHELTAHLFRDGRRVEVSA